MLISEKLKQTNFSPAEASVIAFMFAHPQDLALLTIKEIAEKTFVHPSTLIRIAKKLQFSGWKELRDAFTAEQSYLQGYFEQVDANLPFGQTDGILTIANKIATLEKTTLADTLSLLTHDDLAQAKKLLLEAKQIKIFASNAHTLISQDFALKMQRIQKPVHVVTTFGESAYEAYNCLPKTCAILISYTGENKMVQATADILAQQNIPILAITSIGDNTLARMSNVALRMTTRERLYSKIGNFTTNTSICYLLDTLYSCVFADDYQKNLAHIIKVGAVVDKRPSSSAIMEEVPFTSFQLQDSFLPN
ncbi:MAG: MurR/RpiR family transcriptional regulator [Enterococcus sp.]